jgi:hypothetical protein
MSDMKAVRHRYKQRYNFAASESRSARLSGARNATLW